MPGDIVGVPSAPDINSESVCSCSAAGMEDHLPDYQDGLSQKRMLLLLVPQGEKSRILATEATQKGYEVQVVHSVTAAIAYKRKCQPAACVVDLTVLTDLEQFLHTTQVLAHETPPAPVVVLSPTDTLVDRVEATRAGAKALLNQSTSATEIINAVAQQLRRLESTPARILVVDDDPNVLAQIIAICTRKGMTVLGESNPLAFWDTLASMQPDLLVLDAEMPRFSGLDLCRVVRSDPRWDHLPILFLAAQTGGDLISEVFAAGADDFISKPLVGPELITRIANRLDRLRLRRQAAEVDYLTGVSTRMKSEQQITQYLRLSKRYGKPFSLALIDLDHFKSVNDSYGHATGDEVLRTVGALLQRHFRGEDVVARWGGEEFVVGMYTMQCSLAVQRLTETLEHLRSQMFRANDDSLFQVTFSAGVAEFPGAGADLPTLYKAADAALYQAKAAGRNRIQSALPTPSKDNKNAG